MVKSLVSKLSTASSNLSLASTFGVGSSHSSSAAEETNYAKHRNDPGRFFGDGVQFKAKLIGILEVGEARGDRMCQEALQDLKMAIRAAGEHKQRITIHVTIDGLRLRDEKTGDSLYHHPVHKISFIAQDMTDSRAFGYIFGSPDSGHRFFGIKTDKAASQVVLAMRDLFQVVFELKKKEIEMARQQIQGKSLHEHASQLASLSALRAGAGHADLASGSHPLTLSSLCGQDAYSNGTTRLGVNLDVAKTSGAAAKEISPESVADLVDLEQELTSLQRGITQMERITPSEPGMHHPSSGGGGGSGHPGSLAKSASEDDPFGDSFICVPSYSILPPPPESGRNRHKPQKTPESTAALDAILSPPPGASSSPAPGVACQASGVDNDDDSWLHELDQQSDVFDTTNVVAAVLSMAPLAASESTATPTQQLTEMSSAATAAATASTSLADLDMGGGLTGTAATEEPAIMSLEPLPTTTTTTTTTTTLEDPANPVLLPRDTDPFSPTRKKSDPDPFQEGDLFAKLDAFEFDAPAAATLPAASETRTSAFNGPLQVQLPPEKAAEQLSTVRNRPTVSVSSLPNPLGGGGPLDVISSISNKKMPHLFGQARGFSKRGDSSSSEIGSSVNMRRLQESDSLSETEAAPEPPPRPDSAPCAGPPPLPPKKQFSDLVIRPSPAPPTAGRYEYLNSSSSSTRRTLSHSLADAPPIPLPSRRVGRTEACFPGPGRPRKPHQPEDDYMMPLGPPPPLLPPPNQPASTATSSTARARPQRQQSLGRPQDIYENKAEILAQAAATQEVPAAPALPPDITLTQLLTLGMDDLAVKLNVPASKLSTMTLVQLTSYLSEYLSSSEKSSQCLAPPAPAAPATVAAPVVSSSSAAVFKVNFDQQTSFVASFDDTFGEDEATLGVPSPPEEAPIFVANFANFNDAPMPAAAPVAVPSADRYAVFREIIDQELQQQQQETDLMGDLTPPPVEEQEAAAQEDSIPTELPLIDAIVTSSAPPSAPPPPLPKIDTKITEVVAQAKDRYAALRDIILVENLFDKPQPAQPPPPPEKDLLQDFPEFSDEFNEDQDLRQIMDLPLAEQQHPQDRHGLVDSRGFPAEPSSSALTVDDDDEDEDADAGGESSMDSNEKDGEPVSGQDQYEKLSTSTQQLDAVVPASLLEEESSANPLPHAPKQDHKFLSVLTAPPGGSGSGKDDIEIDELMHRAISNLSLDSRDRISPANSSAAPSRGPQSLGVQQFNDVSTSPIPLQKSPAPQQQQQQPSPVPSHLSAVSQLIDTATKQMLSEREREKQSWATFDSPKAKGKARLTLPPPPPPASNTSQQDTAESPCSSDPRDDGWSKQQRRWAKKERHQTSSSSRDLSPWDDETPEYVKRRQMAHAQVQPQHTDRHGYYMRHARRMNSCDEDYDYDAELMARREREQQQRKFKHGLSRSRDNFDLDSPSWYHHPTHHTWSPQEIEQGVRARSFERSAYERSSYGPPMYADKRGGQPPQLRSKYRGERERDRDREREREREYRDYARPSYDFDYENVYELEQRGGRSPMAYKTSGRGAAAGDYMYERERERDRDRKSFDRESLESFESATRRRRSFGSGNDVYGSLDSRDEYRGGVDRERGDRGDREREQMKTRSLRKPTTTSGKLRISGDIDYEQDSEQDFQQRASVRSLQRPSQLGGGDAVLSIGGAGGVGGGSQRLRKSSGSSPWDGEEPTLPGQKSWKRPASVAETERRLAESRRAVALGQTPSDGEKERRFRKKTRARSAKDLASVGGPGAGSSTIVNPPPPRYVGGSGRGMRDNYDYMSSHQQQQRKDVDVDDDDVADDDDDDEDYVDDEPPTDEDKFERLNRRRHEMHQRMLESERRQMERHPTLSKNRSRGGGVPPVINSDYGFVDSYEQTPTPTPRSNASSTPAGLMSGGGGLMGSGGESSAGVGGKFNFDDGFESDFNQSSPPPAPAGTASSCNSTPAGPISAGSVASGGSKSLFRFSNDFSEKGGDKREHFDMEAQPTSTPPITQKLRFDDNVKISQFDDAAFEDDFAKASFDFEKEQQTVGGAATVTGGGAAALTRKQNMRTSKLQQRQELIKKSESVNIFAKKQEDPFEDDEFFKSPDQDELQKDNDGEAAHANNKFQWNEDENFAKFDENM
ncbi:protein disabled-like isoform X3 [Drosophila guanche]|uniref:protein disabled-like isoform X3 n=1 Tax=Drosophila guanche TaxID=7266 RepID=UPI00147193A4|nr:protein disabled-like isoform X3 [Drosophila guanche]